MILLRPAISVRELPPNAARLRSHLPSIRSLVSERPTDEEVRILEYLAKGVFGGYYPDPGLERDVLAPGTRIEVQPRTDSAPVPAVHPHSLLTDGVWLWPGVLRYYVAKYHLKLDPAFIDHARANHWEIRPSDVRLADLSWDAFESAGL
jgi:hypothetical protein